MMQTKPSSFLVSDYNNQPHFQVFYIIIMDIIMDITEVLEHPRHQLNQRVHLQVPQILMVIIMVMVIVMVIMDMVIMDMVMGLVPPQQLLWIP